MRWRWPTARTNAAQITALVDTSVLIDYLRGHAQAATVLEEELAAEALQASEITRLEVLAGMRWPSLPRPSEQVPGC